MFTGIIQKVVKVKSVQHNGDEMVLGVHFPKGWRSSKTGDSIAVNGVCLTLVEKPKTQMKFFCQKETLDRTNLGFLVKGDFVNIEPAMTAKDAFGGHMVQGHVDFTTKVLKVESFGEGKRYWLKRPKAAVEMILKGSVTLDGISLTISRLQKSKFSVDIIPHTLKMTNISEWGVGTPVNIETDMIGKYIRTYLEARSQGGEGKGIQKTEWDLN